MDASGNPTLSVAGQFAAVPKNRPIAGNDDDRIGQSMQASRKVFRIETLTGQQAPTLAPTAANDAPSALQGHSEIMAELKALRALVQPVEQVSSSMLQAYRDEMREAQKLKTELEEIAQAIDQTKREIATLHVSGFKGREMTRVTHELDAIVDGTREATDGILTAAEAIDQLAGQLSAAIKNERQRGVLDDMQQKTITIFEHCNFQDITGQRITKVVNTLKFIEERIVRMMDIWGGLEKFQGIAVDTIAEKEGDATLLNGPRLEEDAGHASQDDIDALFA